MSSANSNVFSTSKIDLYDLGNELNDLVSNTETALQTLVTSINTNAGSQLNQAQLLNVQIAIQSWSIASGAVTGILRGIGDGLSKVTQNVH